VDRLRVLALTLLTLAAALDAPVAAAGPVAAQQVASGLDKPVFVTAPAGDARLFIVELPGLIRILDAGVVQPTPFLDIRDRVVAGGESGLLGLAFAPDYAASGSFYVYYSRPGSETVVSRFQVSGDPGDADENSETKILRVKQPFGNHNGGTIAFDADGFLLLGLGDGGGGFDPDERAQDPLDLLGKMIRIDPGFPFAAGSRRVRGQYYAIPQDNPWTGSDGIRDEIWAFGLRNPYRFSFDRSNGDLWIGDVGQNTWEEINHEPSANRGGRNWGWDVKEGPDCVRNDAAKTPKCNDASLSDPIHTYRNEEGTGCSVTGGYVYRGADIPAAQGLYFFGDFCSGRVWALDPSDADVDECTDDLGAAGGAFGLVGIGEDGDGELYLVHRGSSQVDTANGTIHKLVPPAP
jgi:glucose/arabinose dehydrogenase